MSRTHLRRWAAWPAALPLAGLVACALVLGAALAGAAVQPAARQRVLVMSTPPEQVQDRLAETLAQGLAAAGDRAEVVRVGWPADTSSEAEVARHLLKHGPADLVVGVSLEVAKEVQRQAPGMQMLFDAYNDPRRSCVVESLDKPGKNATGTFVLGQEGDKMTDLLLAAFPRLRQVVFLVTDDELGQQPCPNEFAPRPADHRCRPGWVDDAAEQRRLAVAPDAGDWARPGEPIAFRFWRVCSVPDIVALGALASQPQTGVVVLMRDLFYYQRELLVKTLNETRKPTVFLGSIFVTAGGLMALHPKLPDTELTTLRLTRLILHGRPAGSLPVSTPRSNAIVFNRAAARRAGLVPSVSFLRRVDSFVEYAPGSAPPPAPRPPPQEKQAAAKAAPGPR
ncbi:MAG TPA: hypothetical protein VLA16_05060 [Ideonella sp.]|nr:hypothetical protein [Ideonella sp.]